MESTPLKDLIKCVPLTPDKVVCIAPIIIGTRRENQEKLSSSKLTRLFNISGKSNEGEIEYKLPRIEIEIFFLRSLFNHFFANKDGKGKAWFPIPSAFQSKTVKTLRESLKKIQIYHLLLSNFAGISYT
ncbi:hypothetical protein [Candidatus Endomicrobiellum agilis]|uniref:hypothetical protein n=1 Tax=Candidatus Endomicrobiellum agilis TaxID=3238957 RepID=UPI0035769C88|nr:hypothetical protein [Endomicrobium sp.]